MIAVRAGIDTWSPCWYVDPESTAACKLTELASARSARGFLVPESIGGYRVGWHRSAGMLYAEGHGLGDELLKPGALEAELAELTRGLGEAGVPVPTVNRAPDWCGKRGVGFDGIRRCDSTCDVELSDAGEGLAVLAGVAAIARVAGRVKGEVIFSPSGDVETVYWRGYSGKRILGRWYDKGVESGRAARGLLIRPEDQRRYPVGCRRDVGEMTASYVREAFQRRFVDLWRASEGVKVAGRAKIARDLVQRAHDGEIRGHEAVLLIGWTYAKSEGLEVPARTRRRHDAALRGLGLVVADGCLEEVEVDLGEVLDAVMDSGAWGEG